MKNNDSNKSRRKLLKSIAAGSGAVIAGKSLPDNWARPVVDSVMIPAHAQTSGGGFVATNIILAAAPDRNEFLDVFVPSAQASVPPVDIADVCINYDGGYARIQTTVQDDPFLYRGEAMLPAADSIQLFGPGGEAGMNVWISVQYNMEANSMYGDLNVNGEKTPYNAPESSAPCQLTPEALVPSDRSIKDNFTPVDEQEILRKVANLPIEMWNYTDREKGVRHIGPMAQDFMESFNVGDSDRHIHMVDANGVNLAAIKALNTKLEEKDTQIRDLQEQLAEIMNRLEKLA